MIENENLEKMIKQLGGVLKILSIHRDGLTTDCRTRLCKSILQK